MTCTADRAGRVVRDVNHDATSRARTRPKALHTPATEERLLHPFTIDHPFPLPRRFRACARFRDAGLRSLTLGGARASVRGGVTHTHTHTHNTYDSTHCTPPFLCLCFECTTSRLFADHGPGFKATGRCSRGSARLYRGTFAGECRHRREGGVPALQQLEDVTRPIMST